MSAGAERPAWIDHDGALPAVGLLPGRPDPEAARTRRTVKRAPGILPAGRDGIDGEVGEDASDRLDVALVDVEREHEGTVDLELLEAAWEEIERGRPRLLGLRERHARR